MLRCGRVAAGSGSFRTRPYVHECRRGHRAVPMMPAGLECGALSVDRVGYGSSVVLQNLDNRQRRPVAGRDGHVAQQAAAPGALDGRAL